jgi:hypothetical protein
MMETGTYKFERKIADEWDRGYPYLSGGRGGDKLFFGDISRVLL